MPDVIDASCHPLVDGLAPPWCSFWGEDRFGVYAGFEVGKGRQKMRWIPPGRFRMGSPTEEPGRAEWEGPVHDVTIAAGFWLGDTQVTQALWEAAMGDNPSHFVDPQRPIERVSFRDVQRFLAKANETHWGKGLVLLSEAQWEYACRAGTKTATYAGAINILGVNNAPALNEIAWYGGNSGFNFDLEDGVDSSGWSEKQYPHERAGTRKVAQKAANPWGLYDMLGNVWEWTEDEWHDSYKGAPTNGSARVGGRAAERVVRGGSWDGDARLVRAAYRSRLAPDYRDDGVGFRCARVQA